MPTDIYTDIYIAIGTNLGDKLHNLQRAISVLKIHNISIQKVSKVYKTAPMYKINQPPFLNMAVYAKTDISAECLLKILKHIEVEVGRTKTYTNGPRIVDLDILYYGDMILKSEHLQIPHPRISERPFVLYPMCDIAPNHLDPRTQKTIKHMADAIPHAPDISVYAEIL